MRETNLIADVAKGMALVVLVLFGCRYTDGAVAILLVAIGFFAALAGRVGWALMAYIFFPFMVILNPLAVPLTGLTRVALRVGPAVITLGLLLAGLSRAGDHRIPIGMIWLYLVVAFFSSIEGYYPSVSCLKIVNCAILFLGLQIGFQNIDNRPTDLIVLRKGLLVLTSFVVWGSILVWIVLPGAAYSTSLRYVIMEEGLEVANQMARHGEFSGLSLFCGITNHSQCLAPILPCFLAWLACDMFFVEKKLSAFHIITILAGAPLIYMTRSRIAFLTSAVALVIIYFYSLNRIAIRPQVRARLKSAMFMACLAVALVACVAQVRNGAISRWLRKTDDLKGDVKSLGDSFTSSRLGKIDENMADFKSSPLMGTGFQVEYDMKYRFAGQEGLILSASIEKSILPLMVLGETGVVGFAVFAIFLLTFFATCARKGYYCCMTLMILFLTTNMAEATFFSPGGIGGTLWVMCVGGGFIIDTVSLYKDRMERILEEQALLEMQMQETEDSL